MVTVVLLPTAHVPSRTLVTARALLDDAFDGDFDDADWTKDPDAPTPRGPARDPASGPLRPQRGLRQTRISVPGTSAPRAGDHWPHSCVRPGVHSGSTRSSRTSPAPTTARSQSPTVRWCST